MYYKLNEMKKLFVAVMAFAALVMAPVSMNAQGERPDSTRQGDPRMQRMDPAKMIEQRVKQMTERYGLDEDQQEKLTALYEEQQEKMKERMGQGGPQGGPQQGGPQQGERKELTEEQRDSIQAAFKAEQEAFDASIKEILTEEQYTKYKEDEANRQQRRQGQPGEGGPQGGPGEGQPAKPEE